MDTEQIWEQLDLRGKKICDVLKIALIGTDETSDEVDGTTERVEISDEAKKKALMMLLREKFGLEDDQIDALLEEEGILMNSSADSEEGEESEVSEESDGEDLGERVEMLRDSTRSSEEEEVESSRLKSRSTLQQRSPLDDDFFDLASFNAETDEAKAKRTFRKPLEEPDMASDEEDKDEDVNLFRSVDALEQADGDAENHAGNFILFNSTFT
jgi:U3 small nucleolar RNA-associated protein MPP10